MNCKLKKILFFFIVLFSCAFVIAHAEIGDVIWVRETLAGNDPDTYTRKDQKDLWIMQQPVYTGTFEDIKAVVKAYSFGENENWYGDHIGPDPDDPDNYNVSIEQYAVLGYIKINTDSDAKVRSYGSTDAKLLGTAPAGTKYEVINYSNKYNSSHWFVILYDDHRVGWVSEKKATVYVDPSYVHKPTIYELPGTIVANSVEQFAGTWYLDKEITNVVNPFEGLSPDERRQLRIDTNSNILYESFPNSKGEQENTRALEFQFSKETGTITTSFVDELFSSYSTDLTFSLMTDGALLCEIKHYQYGQEYHNYQNVYLPLSTDSQSYKDVNWICSDCGNNASGNFCNNCGKARDNDNSIENDTIIKKLIASCPSIAVVNKPTKEFYTSIDEYNMVFQQTDAVNTWRIMLLQDGITAFFDEFNGIIVATKPKGTSAEMSAVLDWEIELLDALPDIKAHAKEKGVNLIAIKYAKDSSDYQSVVDRDGKIDLMLEEKRTATLSIMHDLKGMLDLITAFGELGDL